MKSPLASFTKREDLPSSVQPLKKIFSLNSTILFLILPNQKETIERKGFACQEKRRCDKCYFSTALANVSTSTTAAPPFIKTRAHSLTVEPVV